MFSWNVRKYYFTCFKICCPTKPCKEVKERNGEVAPVARKFRNLVVPWIDMMIVVPPFAERQESYDVRVSWCNVFFKRLWAPNVGDTVDGPCDMKCQNVTKDVVVESNHQRFAEEVSWQKHWQSKAAQYHQWYVVSTKLMKTFKFTIEWKTRNYYLCCHLSTGSDSKSLMSILEPYFLTSGCFLHINHPMCEKKKPRLALWGSAFVSLYLWWTRWSRTHSMTLFWKAIVWKNKSIVCIFRFAL